MLCVRTRTALDWNQRRDITCNTCACAMKVIYGAPQPTPHTRLRIPHTAGGRERSFMLPYLQKGAPLPPDPTQVAITRHVADLRKLLPRLFENVL